MRGGATEGTITVSQMTYDNGIVLEPTIRQAKSENASVHFMMKRVLEIFGTSGSALSLRAFKAYQCSIKVLMTGFQRMFPALGVQPTVS